MNVFFRYFHLRRINSKHISSLDIVHSLIASSLLLVVLFGAHIALMMHYEQLNLADAIWLTFTTATTVGYGDLSATTFEGRMATILLIYLGGIYVLARVVGDYFDYRLDVRDKKRKGLWRWKVRDHIVIINTPSHSGGRYLERLIKQFRASPKYADSAICLLTSDYPKGLPSYLTDLGNIVHYHGSADNYDNLNAVCVQQASDIIVLSEHEHDELSDGRTFDIVHRLYELDIHATLLAECVLDSNRERLLKAGAKIVIRPIRAYPEMIVRAFDAPGSELIIENMFSSEMDTYKRYDMAISGMRWADIVTRLIEHNAGIAVAYIDKDNGQLIYNPDAHSTIEATALIIISKEANMHMDKTLARLLAGAEQ